jgi:hypothetical protein
MTLLKQDGSPVRDDWSTYTAQEYHRDPMSGELVLEDEVVYKDGHEIKTTPRLKIGDGKRTFAELEYISVDSFILPTPSSVTLVAESWRPVLDDDGNAIPNRYYQPVTVNNAVITPNSKVDLQPTPEDLAIFHDKDITFTAINNKGNVRVCLVGQIPQNNYTIQTTVTEVSGVHGDEIIGNTTATPINIEKLENQIAELQEKIEEIMAILNN